MPAPQPLLRAPPFPGIAPAIAAVSHAGDAAPAVSPDARARLFAAVRAARVGGDFWAAPPPPMTGPIAILRPAGPAECHRLIASARRAEDARAPIALLPDARWARRAVGVATVVGACDPWPLLTGDACLHAHGDDPFAALALIAGIPVRWLSEGRFDSEDKVAQALLACAYRDPFTGDAATITSTIDLLAEWRHLIDANRGIAAAAGIARWKRREIARFLWARRAAPLRFRSESAALRSAARAGGGVAIWPSRVSPGFTARAAAAGVPVTRLEDGFIRSVGLGSNLFPPFSIAADARGIHYDPATPSDLEALLEAGDMTPAILRRAEALRALIVETGIGKYGADADGPPVDRPAGRRVVLVAGQVEDDMSVRLGGGGVAGNRDLLARARALEPDAEIWFRPHPDVDAGHRVGRIADDDARRLADRVVRGGGMARLLDAVDGVHVLTSLTGFEALLRGRDVTVHGVPFYAGWGLTRDLAATPARRARRLTLAELIAGVLILYPRYLDPVTRLPCPPETLIARFTRQAKPRATWLTAARALQGRLMHGLAGRP
ncbi:MAG TPA: beta-3-deoxy-D-manno-oct-2-ulosonic acid transferase [Sphingomonas sp.]